MDWAQMMGQQQQMGAGPADYGAIMAPQPDVMQLYRPVQSPQELAKREAGWLEIANRFTSNPNLMRAVGMAGAMLAQPIQPGQNTAGSIANAFVVGTNAYEQGKAADLAQQLRIRKERREEGDFESRQAESRERVADAPVRRRGLAASAGATEAGIPGIQAESRRKMETVDDAIHQASIATQTAELALEKAQGEEAVNSLKRDNDAAMELIKREVPVGFKRDNYIAELQSANAKLEQARAATGASRATARNVTASARQTELENEALEALSPSERAARLNKTSSATSGVEQQRAGWRDTYRKIKEQNPSSAEIQGVSEEEYVARKLNQGKSVDAATQIQRLIASGFDESDPIIQNLRSVLQTDTSRRGGNPPATGAPAAQTKKGEPKRIASQAEFDALPSGTIFIGPDGKKRRKP